MRNPLSLIEMYCARRRAVKPHPNQRGRTPCRVHAMTRQAFLLALVLALSGVVGAQSPCPPIARANNPAEAGSHEAEGKRDVMAVSCGLDTALTRLFTPRTVPKDTYRVYVTDAGVDKVAAAFRAVAFSSQVQGAWVAQEMDPLSAFGEAGIYDRAKVARLYLGIRARVARGPIIEQGRTVASVTLVSPYPDAGLTKLQRGTLIIEFRISSE
jgi:hypothetical protein